LLLVFRASAVDFWWPLCYVDRAMAEKKERVELKVDKREVLGKAVRHLRRQGLTPANVYGEGHPSQAVQVETRGLFRALVQTGGSGLVFLKIEGERKSQPAMVRQVQRDPVAGTLLHVDFQAVALTEKVRTEVPLHFVGEPPGAKQGVHIHELSSLEIEGLPEALPTALEVDESGLLEVAQAIRVADLSLPPGVVALADPETIVSRIEVPAKVEEVAPAVPVAEVPAEGEAPEAPEEEKKKEAP